jgi:hypothetical protein
MESLLQMLPLMIRMSGDQDEVREQASFVAWRVSTGGQLTQTCRPFRLFRKTLVIAVTNETWKKQMESMSGVLLFKLNQLLGQEVVTFIEFRLNAAYVAAGLPKTLPREIADAKPDSELEAAAARIKDTELREQFLRAATSALKNKQG